MDQRELRCNIDRYWIASLAVGVVASGAYLVVSAIEKTDIPLPAPPEPPTVDYSPPPLAEPPLPLSRQPSSGVIDILPPEELLPTYVGPLTQRREPAKDTSIGPNVIYLLLAALGSVIVTLVFSDLFRFFALRGERPNEPPNVSFTTVTPIVLVGFTWLFLLGLFILMAGRHASRAVTQFRLCRADVSDIEDLALGETPSTVVGVIISLSCLLAAFVMM